MRQRRRSHKVRWLLLDLASPLSKRPIAEITPAEILLILKRCEKSGRRETARRLRGVIGKIFRLAVATLRAPTDPTYALQGALLAPVVHHRPAITDEKQLGALMVSIDEYDGWPTLKSALLFLALTMARPGEVRLPAPERDHLAEVDVADTARANENEAPARHPALGWRQRRDEPFQSTEFQ